jgi:hypothetical protein
MLDQAVEQINMGSQLTERGLHRSEKFKVGSEPSVDCGFYPSEEMLVESAIGYLRTIFLTRIEYRRAYLIARLTFVFSDETRSPPVYSYDDEPTESCEVPEGLTMLKFGSNYHFLLSLTI